MSIRVLLADDHTVLREGLRALLEAEPDIVVVGEAEDGLDCIAKVTELRPDVVLMDINMPRGNGLEALQQLRETGAEARVLVLTMHDDTTYLRQVLSSGGAGYVLKQAAAGELLSAIRTVNDGGVYLHPHHAQVLVDEEGPAQPDPQPDAPGEARERFLSLSDREAEVFHLVALGHRNGEIAEQLYISVKTVETYKTRLMRKLGVDNRAALVRTAIDLGLLR